ncbi:MULTISPECIES: tetratricopeptide repeat protein [unclassified Cellulophaga]|uniref:tetratricopeptide repeat protein n=1 Tax=unclassified Cellulophaga TaxID=2634405 RepID=UPI0026E20E57|nr:MULTISPECIES: tetratricopeptide repeat protein [unclassified Cellulophaga]MDO6491740.1 tetratricopeptide repeat protein [Cellulophaga sp. 2_MG-2023]MDO6495605.1 tetratricopeptide repeat protein [Cellulophaga sp. 3_MG-2023]
MRNNFLMLVLLLTLISCGNSEKSDLSKRLDISDASEKYLSGNSEVASQLMETYVLSEKENEYAWALLGNTYIDLEEDAKAKNAFENAVRVDPKMEEAITGLGIVARIEGDYEKAADLYEKAIAINPKYAEAYSSLVVIYLKQKEFEKATEVGVKSYELDKGNPVIAANLCVAFHYAGDSISREKYFNEAKINGYPNLIGIRNIIDGELTVFD